MWDIRRYYKYICHYVFTNFSRFLDFRQRHFSSHSLSWSRFSRQISHKIIRDCPYWKRETCYRFFDLRHRSTEAFHRENSFSNFYLYIFFRITSPSLLFSIAVFFFFYGLSCIYDVNTDVINTCVTFFSTNLEFLLGGYEEAACKGSCRAWCRPSGPNALIWGDDPRWLEEQDAPSRELCELTDEFLANERPLLPPLPPPG